MRIVLVIVASVIAGAALSASAQPPPELEEVQGKYQAALQSIARTYEGQISELNRKYLAALKNLDEVLQSRGDVEGSRLVEAEIAWVEESRDQIPHPWELMDAASEGASYTEGEYEDEVVEEAGAPLVLGPFWNRSTRSGRTTKKELEDLFSPYCEAGVDLNPNSGLSLCAGVTYLMPVEEAIRSLRAEADGDGREEMETPGFPERSFYYHTCSGSFEGRFDTAHLVTDADDKVIAVQFTGRPQESDRRAFMRFMSQDRGLCDLVKHRRKTAADDSVGVMLTFLLPSSDGTTARFQAPSEPGLSFQRTVGTDQPIHVAYPDALQRIREARDVVLRVDTLSASGYVPDEFTRMYERHRLYLPRQIVGLILERVQE